MGKMREGTGGIAARKRAPSRTHVHTFHLSSPFSSFSSPCPLSQWETLKSAVDNATDRYKYNLNTVKEDMTFLMDKTADANAVAKAELVAAATDGKVTITQTKARKSWNDDSAKSVSEKFVKPDFITVTGNKSLSFRI